MITLIRLKRRVQAQRKLEKSLLTKLRSFVLPYVCFNVINIPISWKMNRMENFNEADGSNCYYFFQKIFFHTMVPQILFEVDRKSNRIVLLDERPSPIIPF